MIPIKSWTKRAETKHEQWNTHLQSLKVTLWIYYDFCISCHVNYHCTVKQYEVTDLI